MEHDDYEFLRPGYTRLNFNYFLDENQFNYIVDAVDFIATHGWKLLPHYTFYPDTAEWIHYEQKKNINRRWLHNISYEEGTFSYRQQVNARVTDKVYARYLKEAKTIVEEAVEKFKSSYNLADQTHLLPEHAESIRWFIYPSEALDEIRGSPVDIGDSPFKPVSFSSTSTHGTASELELVPSQTDTSNLQQKKQLWPTPNSEKVLLESKEDITFDEDQLFPKVPTKSIIKPAVKAIKEFGMIKEGDRLLLGLSGGKDSLSLLHVLFQIQKKSPIKFEFGACTVDPQTDAYDPAPLKKYLKALGVPYYFESQNVIELAKEKGASSICSWCSRMKRGILYNIARQHGYNVLVLGQHTDDFAESFMMSIFHNGYLRTMKASYDIDAGDIRVIRPLVYVRERSLKKFARENHLPVINENCPACFEMPKERARIKTLLSSQEHLFPNLHRSLLRAVRPIMERDLVVEKKHTRKRKGHKKFSTAYDNIKNRDEDNQKKLTNKSPSSQTPTETTPEAVQKQSEPKTSSNEINNQKAYQDSDTNKIIPEKHTQVSKEVENSTSTQKYSWIRSGVLFALGIGTGMAACRLISK